MKRKINLIVLILISILSIETISLGFCINMNLDNTKDFKTNDEVIFTLDLDEKIVGASFKIDYDSNILKLVESSSENLSVSENNGKIACVYFDMAKKGTNSLKVKLKVIKEFEGILSFKLNEAKFVTLENETSYSQEEIIGLNKNITIQKSNSTNNNVIETKKYDDTIANLIIPKTGISYIIFILMGLTIVFIIYSAIKIKKFNN